MADADALYAAVEPARSELVRWFEWPDRISSPAAAAEYIAETQKGTRIKLWWLIIHGSSPVGGVQLRLRDGGRAVSLPYWLVPSAQGRGIATEAVTRALNIASAIGFERAEFVIDERNHRSAKLAARLGFRHMGQVLSTLRGEPYMADRFARTI
jgi:RimJ/RimL family protein N-acetyltransferase